MKAGGRPARSRAAFARIAATLAVATRTVARFAAATRALSARARARLAAATLAVMTLAASPAAHANVGDASPPPRAVAASIAGAQLSGQGLLRWFGLAIYEARLWVGPAGVDPARFQTTAFALDLQYARSLSGARIAETSDKEIARLGFGDAAQRAAWLEAMRRLFPDVSAGDRLVGVHRPGAGVTFFRNDQRLGAIDDADFGRAFFAIWLDPRTIAPELRSALLAQAQPRQGAR